MNDYRWPVKVYKWDLLLRQNGWADDIKDIVHYTDQLNNDREIYIFDLDVIESRLKFMNRNILRQEAHQKPKLRTFIVMYDHSIERPVIDQNLSRAERSIVIRLKAWVLPVALETGRFMNIPIEKRTCQVCKRDITKNEYHFLFKCKGLKTERKAMFREVKEICNISRMNCGTKLKRILNPDCVKIAAKHILSMFEKRSALMYAEVQ